MPEADPRNEAAEYFRRAYELQMAGDFQQAIDLYTRSIETFATGIAYTFRGWTYSNLGDYERAIAECEEAIRVDPELGNPYNDIGAYLIEQGKWDEAVPWLERALHAKRYDARCFPFFNLGRVHEHRHDWTKAKDYYAKAYQFDQRYGAALEGMQRMRAMFN